MIAVLFLIGCYSELFFSASSWPVGLLTLSSFYLLLLLLSFCVFWLFVKPAWILIFLITASLSYKHINNILPFRFSSNFHQKKQPNDIRVMSWNVAQMVGGDTLADLNNAYYRKYSFFSIFDFAHRLNFPNYFYSYQYKDNFLSQQHFGKIIFSKYPIVNKQTISNFPFDYNSNFQYADIVKGNDTIRVFNIHLQSLRLSSTNLDYIENPSIKTDTDIKRSKNLITKFKTAFLKRISQADRVRVEINKSPYQVIVCGDFNDVPNSYPYEKIGNGLQDAFVLKGLGLGRTFSGISPTLRIDNIFVDKRFSVRQFTRIPKKLSDHFPIITDIGLLTE